MSAPQSCSRHRNRLAHAVSPFGRRGFPHFRCWYFSHCVTFPLVAFRENLYASCRTAHDHQGKSRVKRVWLLVFANTHACKSANLMLGVTLNGTGLLAQSCHCLVLDDLPADGFHEVFGGPLAISLQRQKHMSKFSRPNGGGRSRAVTQCLTPGSCWQTGEVVCVLSLVCFIGESLCPIVEIVRPLLSLVRSLATCWCGRPSTPSGACGPNRCLTTVARLACTAHSVIFSGTSPRAMSQS